MKSLALLAASSIAWILISPPQPSKAAPEITRDKYDDTVRASVKLQNCGLIGSFAEEYKIMVNLNSCYFIAVSKGGLKTAWLELITNNHSWIEMSHSTKTAGVFITSSGGTRRLTQPAEWQGSAVGGGVLESIVVDIKPGTTAWNLLKSASKIEAKFNHLEYQAVLSEQDRQDIKVAMQSIF